jgi:hypothetical protein
VAIALLAGLGIGEFFAALIITTFVLAAEVFEGLTVGRRRAIGEVLGVLATPCRPPCVVRFGKRARSSVRIERFPPKEEVPRSNRGERTTSVRAMKVGPRELTKMP